MSETPTRQRLQWFLSAPGQAPAAAVAKAHVIGRYRIIREVGRGGMGTVYEAEDQELRRPVALKVLRSDAPPALAARLHREARIAGRLQHPGIVPIHEVGTDGEHHFIAMQFVAGRTLADIVREGKTPRKELLRIVSDVARAVAYAHEQGVVHRDLKPANVMVDDRGHARLMDFGIAQGDGSETALTRTGAVLGTPQYMPPEQVQGRRADERSDVYGLGVILYEAITRRNPFTGHTPAEVYHRILTEEPRPPRDVDRTVARDLEIVCLKAMDRERERRYESAAAFADDLDRFRAGDAIEARPPSLAYRLRRRLVRRAGWVVALAAGVMLAAALVALLGRDRRLQDTEQKLVKSLRVMASTRLKLALAERRNGHPEAMREHVEALDRECEDVRRAVPGLAEPHYLRGRMRRAVMDFEGAMAAQNQALAADPDYAPALYERVVLRSRLHRRCAVELLRQGWGDVIEFAVTNRLEDWGVRHRAPAAEALAVSHAEARAILAEIRRDLDRLSRGRTGLDAAEQACAQGLLAWTTNDADQARRLLASSLEREPAPEEAYEALASLEMEQQRFEESVRWWSKALEADRGYAPHFEGRAEARIRWVRVEGIDGEPADQLLASAIADYERALTLAPGRAEVVEGLGLAWLLRGLQRSRRDRDPVEDYARATATFEEARGIDAGRAGPVLGRGMTKLAVAGWKHRLKEEFKGGAEAALADFLEAARLNPRRADIRVWCGLARLRLSSRGGTREDCAESIVYLNEALELDPGRAWIQYVRGRARAQYGGAIGVAFPAEGRTVLQGAVDDFTAAARDPAMRERAREQRCMVRLSMAALLQVTGDDPDPPLEEGLRELEVDPSDSDAASVYSMRGMLLAFWAQVDEFRKRDPESHLRAAIEQYDRGLALNANARTFSTRGTCYVRLARLFRSRGLDGTDWYRAAVRDYEKVAELEPSTASQHDVVLAECREALKSKP